MWIVRYAVGHRHSIGVLAILLLLIGTLSGRGMSTDILPPVNIPAINVIWTYQGLNPQEMASKLTSFSELAIMNNVDNLREVRSETINGVGRNWAKDHMAISAGGSSVRPISERRLVARALEM